MAKTLWSFDHSECNRLKDRLYFPTDKWYSYVSPGVIPSTYSAYFLISSGISISRSSWSASCAMALNNLHAISAYNMLNFIYNSMLSQNAAPLTLLPSDRPKLHRVLAILSARGLKRKLLQASVYDNQHIWAVWSDFAVCTHHVWIWKNLQAQNRAPARLHDFTDWYKSSELVYMLNTAVLSNYTF